MCLIKNKEVFWYSIWGNGKENQKYLRHFCDYEYYYDFCTPYVGAAHQTWKKKWSKPLLALPTCFNSDVFFCAFFLCVCFFSCFLIGRDGVTMTAGKWWLALPVIFPKPEWWSLLSLIGPTISSQVNVGISVNDNVSQANKNSQAVHQF